MAKRSNVYIEKEISILDLSSTIEKVLKENSITTVGELWEKTRKDLKEYGLKDTEIKQVTIKLQLLGLDLNKKIY